MTTWTLIPFLATSVHEVGSYDTKAHCEEGLKDVDGAAIARCVRLTVKPYAPYWGNYIYTGDANSISVTPPVKK